MDGCAEQDGRNSGGCDQERGRQRRTGQADVRRHLAQTQAARHLRPQVHRPPLRVHFFQTGLRIYRREFGDEKYVILRNSTSMKMPPIRNKRNTYVEELLKLKLKKI